MASETIWEVARLDGCQVETPEGQLIGTLKDVLPTGANDVFVVANGSEEILIPALKSVVLKLAPEDRKIIVRLPQGLYEIYANSKNKSKESP